MNWLIKSFLVLLVISLILFLTVQITDENVINELINNQQSDEDDEQSEQERISIIDGYKAIQLDEEVILVSGLEFEEIKVISISPQFMAYAEVIDVSELVSLKTEYDGLIADRNIVQSSLQNQNKILERANALHKAKSLSTRELEKNLADRDQKIAELNAYNTRVHSFVYSIDRKSVV